MINNVKVLELATGSGIVAILISNTNYYYGIDISEGLLHKAVKQFNKNKFFLANVVHLYI